MTPYTSQFQDSTLTAEERAAKIAEAILRHLSQPARMTLEPREEMK